MVFYLVTFLLLSDPPSVSLRPKFPVPLSSWFEGGNVGVTLNGNLNLE